MVSMAVPRERLAWGFGIHRSFDTAGAMLGPLLAFFILSAIPGAYDTVILLSAVVGVVGVAVIGLFVQDPVPAVPEVAIVVVERPRTLAVLRDARYRRVVVVGSLLSLATISDAFVYLSLRDRADFAIGWFPLLYVATAAVYLVTAPVIGRAADGLGRGRVLVLGHVLLLGVYAILLRGAVDAVLVGAALVLFGLYYAATDGVLAAMVSAAVDEERRATALGILATGTSIGRLGGSVVFGLVWTVASNGVAVRGFAVGLVAALCGAVVVLRRLAEPA
jgi:predicted MFS family arabinose efflux permease